MASALVRTRRPAGRLVRARRGLAGRAAPLPARRHDRPPEPRQLSVGRRGSHAQLPRIPAAGRHATSGAWTCRRRWPPPIGARPVYRAAILVERIPGVKPLAQMLAEPLGSRWPRPSSACTGPASGTPTERVQHPDWRRGPRLAHRFRPGHPGTAVRSPAPGQPGAAAAFANKVAGTPANALAPSCATATGRRGAWASSLDAGEGRPSGADGAQTRRSSPICGKSPQSWGGPR